MFQQTAAPTTPDDSHRGDRTMLFSPDRSAALAGRALHAYLDLVRRTTRFKPIIPGARPWERNREPFIALTWHGQQMLTFAALQGASRVAVLTSLHFDGAVVSSAVERAGFRSIRGSGTQTPAKIAAKRAVPAFFEMRDALRQGTSLMLTAGLPISPGPSPPRGSTSTIGPMPASPCLPGAAASYGPSLSMCARPPTIAKSA